LILMLLLLKIALMVSIAFPIRPFLRFMMCAAALLTGVAIGVMRVAVLAAIVHKHDWFELLHGPAGMSLFPLVGFLFYAPFLLPVEKPLVELLQKVRSNWRSSPPETIRGGRPVLMAAICVAFGICLLKSIWIKSPSSYLSPDARLGFGLSFSTAETRPVPADLLTSRFNSMQNAWRWQTGSGVDKGTTLVCSMNGALAGPDEMIKDPNIVRFLAGQFGGKLLVTSGSIGRICREGGGEGGGQAVCTVPGGSICVKAVNADGDTFFSTSEYASAQRATLFRLSTWRDFLLTGRPLKDCRYWLIVAISGKKND